MKKFILLVIILCLGYTINAQTNSKKASDDAIKKEIAAAENSINQTAALSIAKIKFAVSEKPISEDKIQQMVDEGATDKLIYDAEVIHLNALKELNKAMGLDTIKLETDLLTLKAGYNTKEKENINAINKEDSERRQKMIDDDIKAQNEKMKARHQELIEKANTAQSILEIKRSAGRR